MNDQDKELLKLAAKAAGYEIGEYRPSIVGSASEQNNIFWCRNGKTVLINWNPLEDDGDALRLAAKLHINILLSRRSAVGIEGNAPVYKECSYAERSQVIRRLITEAAAEIAKGLK